MATRQYIGARYVPTFANPVQWNVNTAYEALTIVTNLGNSYTSRKPVPAGTALTDSEYWVNTGNFNAQVGELEDEVTAIETEISGMKTTLVPEELSNKKIVIYGDSLSSTTISLTWAHPNWVVQFTNDIPSTATVINHSESGRRISGSNGVADLMNNDTDLATADVLIIFAGLNDWQYGVEIGDASSQTLTTFCGALYNIAARMISENPECQVYFVSPLRTYRTSEELPPQNDAKRPLNLYRYVMYAFAKRYGWNYIDGFAAPRLDSASSAIREDFIPDGMHITTEYATILAKYIKSHVINLVGDKPTDVNVQIDLTSLVDGERWTVGYCFLIVNSNLEANLKFSLRGAISPNATAFTLPAYFKPISSIQKAIHIQDASDNSHKVGAISINGTTGGIAMYADDTHADAYMFCDIDYKLSLASFVSLGTL